MALYNPANWFWTVAGDTSRVFSSAAGAYVPLTNPAFVAWLGLGNSPDPINTETDLGAVLASVLVRPSHAGVLDGYTGTMVDTVMSHLAFKVLFNHENRIRALEGKAALTVPQARTAIKALM